MASMLPTAAPILIAGAQTLIGSALVRACERAGCGNVLAPTPEELPPTDSQAVDRYFADRRPRFVVVAAGKSGGIGLNQRSPAELMVDNLLVATHLCRSSAAYGVEKLLYLGSSCCYPKACAQPMRVEDLGTGPLEPTSEPYATAKLAGMQLCRAFRRQAGVRFIAAIPADVFGPDSAFDAESSHVIPALIAKMHAAKVAGQAPLTLWGSGAPQREFLYADDLGDACVTALARYDGEDVLNLGGGTELSIRQVAGLIAEVVGYTGRVTFDSSRPDGMMRKLLDSSVIHGLGWRPATPFRAALEATYRGFLTRHPELAGR